MKLYFVESMDEVLKLALAADLSSIDLKSPQPVDVAAIVKSAEENRPH